MIFDFPNIYILWRPIVIVDNKNGINLCNGSKLIFVLPA